MSTIWVNQKGLLFFFAQNKKYNPFAYLRREKDILKLVQIIISKTKGEGEKAGEAFLGESRKALLYGFDRLYFLWSSKRRKELCDTPWYDRWSALFSKPSVSLWVYNIFENISTIYKESYKIEVTKIEKGLKNNASREKGSLNNEWKTNENSWLGCDLYVCYDVCLLFPTNYG